MGDRKMGSARTGDTVSVVGGSAAGFYTACLLARQGMRVRVFERAERLEPFPRTLIVTSRMRELLGSLAEPSVVNEVRRFELFTDGRSATIPLRRPDLVIERARLIRGLAEQAREQGAQLSLGRRFLGLAPSAGGLTLSFARADGGREEVRASTVVGADGALSRVAAAAGWPQQPTVPLVQAIVRLPADLPADTVRVWFVPDDTPYFYWLIPHSPTHGALGVIGEDGQETRRRLESFLDRKQLQPESFQGARIPAYTRWVPVERRLGSARVFLVGDAAGQVKVTTVGGVVTGFRGARGVAEAILHGVASRELARLRRELDVHRLLRRMLHGFGQADYSRLVDLLGSAVRDSLSAYNRDEAGRLIWRLCLRQPRFLLLGVRALLTAGSGRGAGRASHS